MKKYLMKDMMLFICIRLGGEDFYYKRLQKEKE